MPLVANLLTDDMEPRQTYFQSHVSWSLALIALPAVCHFLVQSAIRGSLRRSRDEGRLARLLGPICTFVAASAAGLAESVVGAFLFLARFP